MPSDRDIPGRLVQYDRPDRQLLYDIVEVRRGLRRARRMAAAHAAAPSDAA